MQHHISKEEQAEEILEFMEATGIIQRNGTRETINPRILEMSSHTEQTLIIATLAFLVETKVIDKEVSRAFLEKIVLMGIILNRILSRSDIQ
jgi:hypothetical protein